jgi:RHS repeat-associated protein
MLYTYDDFNREIRREVVQLQNKWSRESMRWLYENGEPPYTERMMMGETQYDTASPQPPPKEGEKDLSFIANEVATATLLATSNKGRIMMTKTRILTASPQPPPKEGEHVFLSTAFYYDIYGRVIQTVADNAMGGIDRTSNSYDFIGNVTVSKQMSTWAGDGDPGTVTLTTVFGYDALKRPTTVRLQVNEAEPATISALEYDELARLKTKKLHNNKEIIDYAYNIRDWITEVNSNLFSYTLTYDKPLGEVAPQYNGNISAMRVRTARQAQQAYAFEYDAINRLTASHFYDNSWSNNYTEQLTYDKNGNITALQRYRHLPEPIDNLVYLYNGNQVATITDNGTPDGYPVGITHYAYDANGNNTFEGTRTRIAYNEINLPRQVQLLGGRGIKNVYAADGRKLKSEAKQGSEYIKEGTKTYSGNLVFDINDELDYIIFPEGRILYDVDDSTFSFEYHLKDHLGSVRVAFVPTTGGTEVVQENSYYPFGAPIADLSWSPKSTNRYGYNGKEHIKEFELDWVDLGHRIYNPLRAQFSTSDRFAEKYYSLSNYSFAAGNPIKIIDMNGDSTVLAGWNNSVGSFNQNFHNGVMDRVENPMLLLNDLNNMAGGILQLLADFTGISDLFGTNQTAAAIDNAISEVSNIPNMSAEEVGSMLAGVSIFAIETAATRKIPLGEIRAIRNVGLAGKVHPKTGVPFDKAGFPDFSNHLYKGGINEVKIAPTGNRLTDAIEANKVAGYGFTPKGYTWHHHQSIGKMQLVETKIHSQTGHTGGFELWKY